MDQEILNHNVKDALVDLESAIKLAKPGDRSELDRRYAVLKTETEKVIAYFRAYILGA